MRSSQLDPTYVSNGLQGPDNISPNGWTPNSSVDHRGATKKTQLKTIVDGKSIIIAVDSDISLMIDARVGPQSGMFAIENLAKSSSQTTSLSSDASPCHQRSCSRWSYAFPM